MSLPVLDILDGANERGELDHFPDGSDIELHIYGFSNRVSQAIPWNTNEQEDMAYLECALSVNR